jgi:hypothetical protein
MKPTVENESCTGCGRDPQINCHVCGHLLYLSEYDDARDERIRELEARIRELEAWYLAAGSEVEHERLITEAMERERDEAREVLDRARPYLEKAAARYRSESCDLRRRAMWTLADESQAAHDEISAILDAIEREREVE